jgi:poly-gamma-glutamate synthase PgsB/CapB
MGPSIEDVASSLAGTVPKRSHLITAESSFAPFLAHRSRKLGSRFTQSDPETVSATELAGFSYVEFPDNVSLALDVCAAVGIPRDVALGGMRLANPDVGALTLWLVREGDKTLEFINAFAANDPDSYLRIWQRLRLPERIERTILLMNIRADRQRRSKDLAPLFGREMQAHRFVLIGTGTRVFADMLKRQGIASDRIIDLANSAAAVVWQRLVSVCPDGGTIVGIGNIAGSGRELMTYLKSKESDG